MTKCRGTKNLKRKTREENDNAESANHVKRPRNKKWLLSELLEMPMDILFEIFGRLDPLDLLNVARTTKALRTVLMSRSSISVWRSARSSIIGLPDCPDDLSEPQYAALMFVTKCSFCQKGQKKSLMHISWYGRFRCCDKCVDLKFVTDHKRRYPDILANWVPCLKFPLSTRQSRIFCRSKILYVLEGTVMQWNNEYRASEDPNRKYQWMLSKLESCYAIQKHALACAFWYKAWQNSTDVDQIHEVLARNATIMDYIEKNIKLDWKEELHKLPPNISNPLDMQEFQDLWAPLGSRYFQSDMFPLLGEMTKSLATKLNKSYTDRRREELYGYFRVRKQILSQIFNICIKTCPINSPSPSLAQFYWLAEDHGLVDYLKPAKQALRVPFDEVVTLWRKYVDGKLIELITKECGPTYVFDPATVLDLATTLFICRRCDSKRPPMRRDHAMVHHCTHSSGTTADIEHRRQFSHVFGQAVWRTIGTCIEFKKGYMKVMQGIIEMCGLDPKVTTARQMDELDPVFECQACSSVEKGRATFSWVSLLRHVRTAHASNPQIHTFRILGEPEATKIRRRIKEEHARSTRQVLKGELKCPYRCSVLSSTFNLYKYRKHMEEKHGIPKVNKEELIDWVQREWVPPMYRSISKYRMSPPLGEDSGDKSA